MIEEYRCSCGALVMQIQLNRKTVVINAHGDENGNIIVRGDRATALPTAERAKELCQRLGVLADRFTVHICPRQRGQRG